MDLGKVEPAVAGPARPQDRIRLPDLKNSFATILGCDYERDTDVAHISKYHDESGSRTTRQEACAPKKKVCELVYNGEQIKLCDGNIVIAAIIACKHDTDRLANDRVAGIAGCMGKFYRHPIARSR